jgi:hypothetical protein
MFSPKGLNTMVVQTATTLALFALVCLSVYPDATIDVFSNATAAELYPLVPINQRHRVFLHRADPRALLDSDYSSACFARPRPQLQTHRFSTCRRSRPRLQEEPDCGSAHCPPSCTL